MPVLKPPPPPPPGIKEIEKSKEWVLVIKPDESVRIEVEN